MNLVESIEQIRQLISEVRDKRKGFITNFYLDEFKHNVWILNEDLYFEWINETLFFVKQSEGFWNVFYNSTTIDALVTDVQQFQNQNSNETLMLDIVGRDAQCNSLVRQFQQIGFSEATSLVRMTKMSEEVEYVEDSSISEATCDEVSVVFQWLNQYFDAKTEQIPYFSELEEYARRGRVLVCHEEGRLAGFLIFEINATTNYLRYWFTHPDFRDKKFGSRLLRRFFEEGKDTKRQLFWVICSNENAIKRYRHFGFKEDNMYDCVMTNR